MEDAVLTLPNADEKLRNASDDPAVPDQAGRLSVDMTLLEPKRSRLSGRHGGR
jgi:hypothetical protein